ncbi:MAG: hypothetical protein H6850_02470 [Alphaproteobacteria bacterium]|nr:MAG: hypothetical protein H6850_02470 [Alphaproteobacteria bacterium]
MILFFISASDFSPSPARSSGGEKTVLHSSASRQRVQDLNANFTIEGLEGRIIRYPGKESEFLIGLSRENLERVKLHFQGKNPEIVKVVDDMMKTLDISEDDELGLGKVPAKLNDTQEMVRRLQEELLNKASKIGELEEKLRQANESAKTCNSEKQSLNQQSQQAKQELEKERQKFKNFIKQVNNSIQGPSDVDSQEDISQLISRLSELFNGLTQTKKVLASIQSSASQSLAGANPKEEKKGVGLILQHIQDSAGLIERSVSFSVIAGLMFKSFLQKDNTPKESNTPQHKALKSKI